MPARKLTPHYVEKVWGRRDVPGACASTSGEPIGEAWFEDASAPAADLLVKFLYTSERLSIQVHPNDEDARRAGYPRGKDEAWYVLSAEAGSTIGVGLHRPVTAEELRRATETGRIEQLLDWKPVEAGNWFYSPAGTIHAIGAGLQLIEIQQNLDLTYRLYDYGRDRPLQVEEALAVARAGPYAAPSQVRVLGGGRTILASGAAFVLEQWTDGRWLVEASAGTPMWFVPVDGRAACGGIAVAPGEVCLIDTAETLTVPSGATALIAYPGAEISAGIVAAI